ncbi:MAG: ATP synthase F1 subunit gamma [Thermoanaerobaculia bacterium]
MPNLRDIRRRIKSVKSTQQITKAMKMVAAARLRKVQEKLNTFKKYSDSLNLIIERVLPLYKKINHPYFRRDGVRKRLVIIVGGDRGLCGSYNSHIIEEFLKYGGKANLLIIPVGARIISSIKKFNLEILSSFSNIFKDFEKIPSGEIFSLAENSFLSGEVQEVFLLSARFYSMGKTPVVFEKLLPLESKKEEPSVEYIFDPPFEILAGQIIERFIKTKIHQVLIESYLAEQFARMASMELATKNAEDMIQSLTLFYNRMRQASITKELIEIVSGAQALRNK